MSGFFGLLDQFPFLVFYIYLHESLKMYLKLLNIVLNIKLNIHVDDIILNIELFIEVDFDIDAFVTGVDYTHPDLAANYVSLLVIIMISVFKTFLLYSSIYHKVPLYFTAGFL